MTFLINSKQHMLCMEDVSSEFAHECTSKKSTKISLITDTNTGEIMCAN